MKVIIIKLSLIVRCLSPSQSTQRNIKFCLPVCLLKMFRAIQFSWWSRAPSTHSTWDHKRQRKHISGKIEFSLQRANVHNWKRFLWVAKAQKLFNYVLLFTCLNLIIHESSREWKRAVNFIFFALYGVNSREKSLFVETETFINAVFAMWLMWNNFALINDSGKKISSFCRNSSSFFLSSS